MAMPCGQFAGATATLLQQELTKEPKTGRRRINGVRARARACDQTGLVDGEERRASHFAAVRAPGGVGKQTKPKRAVAARSSRVSSVRVYVWRARLARRVGACAETERRVGRRYCAPPPVARRVYVRAGGTSRGRAAGWRRDYRTTACTRPACAGRPAAAAAKVRARALLRALPISAGCGVTLFFSPNERARGGDTGNTLSREDRLLHCRSGNVAGTRNGFVVPRARNPMGN